MSVSDESETAVGFIRRLLNAWDCCGTCAGGVLAERDRERDARVKCRSCGHAPHRSDCEVETGYDHLNGSHDCGCPDGCTCNTGPSTDGPEEDCPQHGRPYSYWVEAAIVEQQKVVNVMEILVGEICYVLRDTDLSCVMFVGGKVGPNDAEWTVDMCCLPCRIRMAVS